jgi:hypothetical protein
MEAVLAESLDKPFPWTSGSSSATRKSAWNLWVEAALSAFFNQELQQ